MVLTVHKCVAIIVRERECAEQHGRVTRASIFASTEGEVGQFVCGRSKSDRLGIGKGQRRRGGGGGDVLNLGESRSQTTTRNFHRSYCSS